MNRKNLLIGLLLFIPAAALVWWAFRSTSPSEDVPLSFDATGPASDQAGDCAYTWGTLELPEITDQVQAAMEKVQAGAEARAEAYGEYCAASTGEADFTAMETDFNLTLPVDDLADTEEIGKLIRQSMDMLLERFPVGQTPGPQPGQVNFRFTRAGEEKFLTVSISEFHKLPAETTGAALYQVLFPESQ